MKVANLSSAQSYLIDKIEANWFRHAHNRYFPSKTRRGHARGKYCEEKNVTCTTPILRPHTSCYSCPFTWDCDDLLWALWYDIVICVSRVVCKVMLGYYCYKVCIDVGFLRSNTSKTSLYFTVEWVCWGFYDKCSFTKMLVSLMNHKTYVKKRTRLCKLWNFQRCLSVA